MSKHWPPDNVSRGRFARPAPPRAPDTRTGGDWLSSEAYDALIAAEEQANRQALRRDSKWAKWLMAVGLVAMTVAGIFGPPDLKREPVRPAAPLTAAFEMCQWGSGYNCVVDGGTIWMEGQHIRIADVEAPDTREPGCAAERALSDRAAARLRTLLNSGKVSLAKVDRDMDVYGRKLRVVEVNGASVGETLVSEGLARWHAGGGRPWC